MAIRLKSAAEIDMMAAAAAELAEVFLEVRESVREGITTKQVDAEVEEAILRRGHIPAFKGFHGFSGSACISVNEEVVHGIPGDRLIEDGDVVGLDIGLVREGWFADSAETIGVGNVRPEVERLCATVREALAKGIEAARPGHRLSEIGRAIEAPARREGYGLVESLVGHGIGRDLHEDPQVPNFECFTRPNPTLEVGMVLALEPMFNLGGSFVRVLEDEWTIVTVDGSVSAHYEHTVAITEDGPRILTAREWPLMGQVG